MTGRPSSAERAACSLNGPVRYAGDGLSSPKGHGSAMEATSDGGVRHGTPGQEPAKRGWCTAAFSDRRAGTPSVPEQGLAALPQTAAGRPSYSSASAWACLLLAASCAKEWSPRVALQARCSGAGFVHQLAARRRRNLKARLARWGLQRCSGAGICSPVLIGTNPLQPLDPTCFPSPRARPNKTRCSSFNALLLIPPSPPAVAATNLFPAALCPRLIRPATPARQLRRDAAAPCFCIASPRLASPVPDSNLCLPRLSLARTEICLCFARLATLS